MARVQILPWWWAIVAALALALLARVDPVSVVGWVCGLGYLLASAVLLSLGLARHRMPRLGPANATTATRSALVGILTALVATALAQHLVPAAPAALAIPVAPAALIVALAAPALALDAVDGWLARRTHTESALGARFDMEVDAFLLLVLSAYLGPELGWWVLAIGLMRYAFVAAGWLLPWMRAQLPPRYWRKVVTAACGVALVLAASDLLPRALAAVAVAIAIAMLVESFGRDVLWLWRVGARGGLTAAASPRSLRSPRGRPARSLGGSARPSRWAQQGTSRSST